MRDFEITPDQAAGIERAAQWHEAQELAEYRKIMDENAGGDIPGSWIDIANVHREAAETLRALIVAQATKSSDGTDPAFRVVKADRPE